MTEKSFSSTYYLVSTQGFIPSRRFTISMSLLKGFCRKEGRIDELEIFGDAELGYANPCPVCQGDRTCDTHWEEEVFSDYDLEHILNDHDIHPDSNVFPSGVLGTFQPHLVIFVDHPKFDFSMLNELLRRRVSKHDQPGTATESIMLVAMSRRSMQRRMGTSHLKKLVDQWRWMNPAFAPIVRFRTIDHRWSSRNFTI